MPLKRIATIVHTTICLVYAASAVGIPVVINLCCGTASNVGYVGGGSSSEEVASQQEDCCSGESESSKPDALSGLDCCVSGVDCECDNVDVRKIQTPQTVSSVVLVSADSHELPYREYLERDSRGSSSYSIVREQRALSDPPHLEELCVLLI